MRNSTKKAIRRAGLTILALGGMSLVGGKILNKALRDTAYETACETYQGYYTRINGKRVHVFDRENKDAKALSGREDQDYKLTTSSNQIHSWLRRHPIGEPYCFEYTRQPDSSGLRELVSIQRDTSKNSQ